MSLLERALVIERDRYRDGILRWVNAAPEERNKAENYLRSLVLEHNVLESRKWYVCESDGTEVEGPFDTQEAALMALLDSADLGSGSSGTTCSPDCKSDPSRIAGGPIKVIESAEVARADMHLLIGGAEEIPPKDAEALERFRVRLFGPLEVEFGDRRLGSREFPGIKPRQVLEILLIRRGQPVSAEQLSEALWGDNRPVNVPATLNTYVSILRHTLDPAGIAGRSLIVTAFGAYRLETEQVDVDLDRFDRLVARAHVEESKARALLTEALLLVRGEVLQDEPYLACAMEIRERYRLRWLDACFMAADLALLARDFKSGLGYATEILAAEPFGEPAYQIAMIASYALGRQDRALSFYARCRKTLVDELGIEPTEETTALHTAILSRASSDALLSLHRMEATDAGA